MKKILITGADGFIGSHLAEKLAKKKNFKVFALVQYNSFGSNGWLENIDLKIRRKINIVSGDIRDKKFVNTLTRNKDIICHLAALISIPYSYYSPYAYVDTNINGTLNLLESSLENNVKKFIHTSTSEVYGSAQFTPIDEKHPINAQSPYAATKVAADQLVNSYRDTFGLNTITLRPFNTFGPRQSERAIIPSIINQAMINDKNIKLGNIDTKRDFTFINDTINAFERAIKTGKKIDNVINVGTNYSITIKSLAKIIFKILGKNLKILKENRRVRPIKGEVDHLKASNLLAKKKLLWKPNFNGEKGLKKALIITINWYKNNKNFYNNHFYF